MPKVMLVEDDNNLREIYDARLVAEGYEIVSAHDGEEALALAVKERPDLIISDVMMPKISGFDMLDILRSTPETRNTKVIMMTALGQAEDRARADKLGADRYLVKSQVTLEDVIKVAHEVLGDSGPAPATTASGSAPAEQAPPTASPAPAPTQADVPVVAAPPVVAEPPVAAAASTPAPAPTQADVPVVEPPAPAAAPAEPVISMPPTPASTPPPTDDTAKVEVKVAPAEEKPAETAKLAQTKASEAETAEKQIQDFVANNPAISGSTGAPATTEAEKPASQPVSIPVNTPAEPSAQDQLANPTAETTSEPVPEPPSHKKLVLQPTDNALAPSVDINALLEKENQKPTDAPVPTPAANTVITPSDSPASGTPPSDISL